MNGFGHVWTAVENFRRANLAGQEERLPVDVFTLVELRLRLDVVPFDDLSAKYGIDAALMPDFSGLYVDAESYVLWERGPVWKQNRLRFSVAHELGHFVLHRDAAAKVASSRSTNLPGISMRTTARNINWSKRPTNLPAGSSYRSSGCGRSSTSSRFRSAQSCRTGFARKTCA